MKTIITLAAAAVLSACSAAGCPDPWCTLDQSPSGAEAAPGAASGGSTGGGSTGGGAAGNRSGHADGTNPGGVAGPSGGTDNPGQGGK